MDFGSLATFGPVVACSSATFGGALQGATIENYRRGFSVPTRLFADHHSEAVQHILEAPGLEPSLSLLAHRFCWGQVVWEIVPLHAGTSDIKKRVEDFAQRVNPLRRVFRA